MATAASWPPIFIIAWGIVIFYCLTSLQRLGIRFVIETALSVAVLSALTNSWWLAPYLSSLGHQFVHFGETPFYRGFTTLTEYIRFEVNVNASAARIIDVVRLFGYWPWFQREYGAYYVRHYGSVCWFLVSALIPIFVFVSGLAKANRRTSMFLFLTVVGLFLAKSTNSPLGCVNAYLYESIPYGWVFVNSFQNFVLLVALGYSTLLAEGYRLCVAIRPRFRAVFATFLVLVILVNSYPVFTNQVYDPPQTYRIPSYYSDLRDWLITRGNDFKLLPLPETQMYQSYDWGYSGPEILHYFTATLPLVYGVSGMPYETPLIQRMFDYIRKDSERFIRYARMLHVRYIVLDNSLSTNYIPESGGGGMNLEGIQGVRFLRHFGKIDVYEIQEYIPIAYVPQTIHVLSGNVTSVPEDKFPTSTSAFLLKDHVPVSILGKLSNASNASILSFERRDTCTFKIQMTSEGPSTLVLGIPFSELWTAQVNGSPASNHFTINGFANAWVIENSGTVQVEITYAPQKYVTYGAILSLMAIGCMTAILAIVRKRLFVDGVTRLRNLL